MADEVRDIPTRLEYLRQRIQPALEEPVRTHVIVGAAALGVGLGIGYILGKRRKYEAVVELEFDPEEHDDPNQMKFEFDADELADELIEIREYLDAAREERLLSNVVSNEEPREVDEDLVIKDDFDVEDFVAEKIREATITTAGSLDSDDEPLVTGSIFAADDDDWNLEEEMQGRSSEEPYILHKDEFYGEEKGYSQTTLTYYAGDKIMVDQDEAPIYNHERVTGPLKFGHGSGDANVVYIRNDRLRAEYEIIFDSGLFSVEVLGLDIEDNQRTRDRTRDRELRHSSRKFRDTE